MNHVLMDFENVPQVDLTLIGARSVSFTLMVGPKQPKLDSTLVEKLMEHSASVRLVKLKSVAVSPLGETQRLSEIPVCKLMKSLFSRNRENRKNVKIGLPFTGNRLFTTT